MSLNAVGRVLLDATAPPEITVAKLIAANASRIK